MGVGEGGPELVKQLLSQTYDVDAPKVVLVYLENAPKKGIGPQDVAIALVGETFKDGFVKNCILEFAGPGVKNLSMDDRFTIANMAIEAGGKNGIFPIDDVTRAYMKEHSTREWVEYEADEDAEYDEEYVIDLSTLKSTVAFPHLPENTHTMDEINAMDDIKIDQVVIGSCTNGRMDDLRIAASIMKGKKVAKGLRVIVIPGTQKIYLDAMEEGLVRTFIEAGAIVSTPTCGPCLGGYMGVLAEGERCVSTTNRNFVGRMGHVESEVYLASPAVAAASAITGKISGPDEVM
jgi:3-isopropylmalate/(R)-2-methylmalate dehydratase large subunit